MKSGVDLVRYGMGATDKFKGTGVFSSIEFQREAKVGDTASSTNAVGKQAAEVASEKKKDPTSTK